MPLIHKNKYDFIKYNLPIKSIELQEIVSCFLEMYAIKKSLKDLNLRNAVYDCL